MRKSIPPKEFILRHIVNIHFDAATNTVKLSAFDIKSLQSGLSVSIKSKLTPSIKQDIINQLQINGGTYKCDFESSVSDIHNISYNKNHSFEVVSTPLPNNASHADIKFSQNTSLLNKSYLRKLRKELMDKFCIKP